MRAHPAMVLALAATLILIPAVAPGGNLRERAEALWNERGDLSKAEEALEAFEALLADHPEEGDLLARTARLSWWIGRNLETQSRDEAVVLYEKAEAYGRRAAAVAPGRPGGYFFEAASLARRLDLEGDISAVLEAREIRKLNEKAAAREPGFFYGGPDRLFSIYYANLPGLLGGSTKKAIDYGQRAVAAFPGYIGNRVALAEAYHRSGNNAMARKELEIALATPDDTIPEAVPEQRLEKKRAETLYRRVGK